MFVLFYSPYYPIKVPSFGIDSVHLIEKEGQKLEVNDGMQCEVIKMTDKELTLAVDFCRSGPDWMEEIHLQLFPLYDRDVTLEEVKAYFHQEDYYFSCKEIHTFAIMDADELFKNYDFIMEKKPFPFGYWELPKLFTQLLFEYYFPAINLPVEEIKSFYLSLPDERKSEVFEKFAEITKLPDAEIKPIYSALPEKTRMKLFESFAFERFNKKDDREYLFSTIADSIFVEVDEGTYQCWKDAFDNCITLVEKRPDIYSRDDVFYFLRAYVGTEEPLKNEEEIKSSINEMEKLIRDMSKSILCYVPSFFRSAYIRIINGMFKDIPNNNKRMVAALLDASEKGGWHPLDQFLGSYTTSYIDTTAQCTETETSEWFNTTKCMSYYQKMLKEKNPLALGMENAIDPDRIPL